MDRIERIKRSLEEFLSAYDEDTIKHTRAEGYLRVIRSTATTALELMEEERIP